MSNKKTIDFNPTRGEIYYADLGQETDVITQGLHPCVFYKKIGNTAQVIPITSYKGKVHWSEKLLEPAESNLPKKSVLKIGELRPIGIDRIQKKKVGYLSREKVLEVERVIQKVILS